MEVILGIIGVLLGIIIFYKMYIYFEKKNFKWPEAIILMLVIVIGAVIGGLAFSTGIFFIIFLFLFVYGTIKLISIVWFIGRGIKFSFQKTTNNVAKASNESKDSWKQKKEDLKKTIIDKINKL